jgi:hypothetical protein
MRTLLTRIRMDVMKNSIWAVACFSAVITAIVAS